MKRFSVSRIEVFFVVAIICLIWFMPVSWPITPCSIRSAMTPERLMMWSCCCNSSVVVGVSRLFTSPKRASDRDFFSMLKDEKRFCVADFAKNEHTAISSRGCSSGVAWL